jgi:hypothetical protein
MRSSSILALSLLLTAACAGKASSTDGAVAEAVEAELCSAGCDGSGEHALRATFEDLAELAGRSVSVSAVEPTLGGSEVRRVILSSRVESDGRFALSCTRALRENYGYPSYGVWIDKNGDGKCGAGDLALVGALFYGWDSDISLSVDKGGLVPEESWSPAIAWEDAGDAQSWGAPFCEYYGLPR